LNRKFFGSFNDVDVGVPIKRADKPGTREVLQNQTLITFSLVCFSGGSFSVGNEKLPPENHYPPKNRPKKKRITFKISD
jgi:hypothetical protein